MYFYILADPKDSQAKSSPGGRVLTAKDKADIVNAVVEDFVHPGSVAKQFGCSLTTVYSLVKKSGFKLPENGYVKSAVAREVMEEIIQEASGTTPPASDKIDELIRTHGVSYQDIQVIVNNSRKRSYDQASKDIYTLEVH